MMARWAEHDQRNMKLVIGVLVLDIILLAVSVGLIVLTVSQGSATGKTSQTCADNTSRLYTCADNSSTIKNKVAIHELFGFVEKMRRSLAKADKSLVECHEQITDVQQELAKLTTPNKTIPAAFYVSLSQDVSPEVKRPILFDRETLDLTKNYNPNDGKFTANIKGVYSFSWTVATNYGEYIFATLMHNDFVTGRTIAGDSVDSSMATGTAILRLNEGDTVMVIVDQRSSSADVMATMSALSGFFISASA